jgi:asparagine synthase (glutamine-hydrolysing)
MCGICGIYGKSDENLIKRMCRVMFHRGPDDEGIYMDETISLGMRRLSIIDLTTGHQPIHNEDETLWIVFNGEIYNFQELREYLEKHGHRFYTKSDTEVILHLYEEFGEECVQKLRGMFAFALWDKPKRKLFLVRDRLGIKPLYYTETNGKFIFASEIKAILQHPQVKCEVNLKALDEYLTFQYILAPNTLFEGIWKLLPGHTLSYCYGKITLRQYWDVEFPQVSEKIDEREAAEELLEHFRESIRLRLISDVPLGVLLSGGVDSSAVVAVMSRLVNCPIKTFTVGFAAEGDYDETKYARLVAKRFETDHQEVILQPNACELLPKLIWHLDEPIADQAALPTYLVCELARKSVTVVLTGEGGDELFAGYPRYLLSFFADVYHKFPAWMKEGIVMKGISFLPNRIPYSKYLKKVAFSNPDAMNRNVRWMSNFLPEEKERLYSDSLKKVLSDNSISKKGWKNGGMESWVNGRLEEWKNGRLEGWMNGRLEGWRDGRVFASLTDAFGLRLNALMYMDMKTWLVDDILMKVDRMSMATSVEARVPFLDHKLVEFVSGLPPKLKLKGFTTKYILKKTLNGLLPKEILNRRKHAFRVPASKWLQRDLKFLTSEILLSPAAQRREYFNIDYIRQLVNSHLEGRIDAGQKLWNLICLELWHRIYIDKDW